MRQRQCESCGARVWWAKHHGSGKWMPFDVVSGEDKTWVLEDNVARMAHAGDGPTRYDSHFATCPNADQHRRKS